MDLSKKFNPQVYKIAVSLIRQFDEKVSDIPDILRLTLGEPDFNTPEHVKQAGIDAITGNASHYTGMRGLPELREAAADFMAKKYHVAFAADHEILVSVGVTEAIAASLLSILEAGDVVLLPSPIYPGYEPVITLAGAEAVYMDTSADAFVLTPENLNKHLEKYEGRVKAVILNYPSNPTGVTYTRAEVAALAGVLKEHEVFVVSDEVYSELAYDHPHVSIAEFLPEQTILLNGLSKSHAMTGWRLGFIYAPKIFIDEIIKVHQYLVTAAATVSQKAAVEALTAGADDGLQMRKAYLKRRDYLCEALKQLGFEVARPNGAFYLFAKIPAGQIQDSMAFCVDLAEKAALAVIPGIAFGQAGEGYIRISYASDLPKLEEAVRRLEKYLALAKV
ncbi:MAG: pyridoxal phosphate-dependent aminotransferase [Enterococcaceae bacterium]|jgi:aminotransferase|nr:pyridoxal phosphate-dependent aminotransferase [Enterococcaceae bacterium]MCI1919892.1 pyridoxal phosphate-dependent aminotransferase [Enterococcaceae bacterium]